MKKFSTRTIVVLGLLTALEIVLNRFLSINTWSLKIGFSFIPVAVAGMVYGPVGGAIVCALGDFLGAILFPIGTYFPGFTLTACFTGAVLGWFLHKNPTPVRILMAVLINNLFFSLVINSVWISVLYSRAFAALLVSRLLQCAVMVPVQFITISAIKAPVAHLQKGILHDDQ